MLFDLDSPLASLLVSLVFPHWLDAGLKHLDAGYNVFNLLLRVIGVCLEFIVLVIV